MVVQRTPEAAPKLTKRAAAPGPAHEVVAVVLEDGRRAAPAVEAAVRRHALLLTSIAVAPWDQVEVVMSLARAGCGA
jgi:hypothetical protein